MGEFAAHNSSPASSHLPVDLVLNTNAIHLNPKGIFVQIHLSPAGRGPFPEILSLNLQPLARDQNPLALGARSSGKSCRISR